MITTMRYCWRHIRRKIN